jgi:enoyl-CoA hydratase/carnithine racemase
VVPDAELLPAARTMAARIAANPTQAVRMTKRLLWEARTASLDTILDMSAGYQALAHATDDNREAMAAFLEKRPPNFTGR